MAVWRTLPKCHIRGGQLTLEMVDQLMRWNFSQKRYNHLEIRDAIRVDAGTGLEIGALMKLRSGDLIIEDSRMVLIVREHKHARPRVRPCVGKSAIPARAIL